MQEYIKKISGNSNTRNSAMQNQMVTDKFTADQVNAYPDSKKKRNTIIKKLSTATKPSVSQAIGRMHVIKRREQKLNMDIQKRQ
jgi:hypothetical protein